MHARAVQSGASVGLGAIAATRSPRVPLPSELLESMLAAADQWWALQGSAPPCPGAADVRWGQLDELHSGFAYFHSCMIVLSPRWWATQAVFVTGRARVSARRRAAAEDLALIMHERGHNIGYGHDVGGIMREGSPVVPGWAVEWAGRAIR